MATGFDPMKGVLEVLDAARRRSGHALEVAGFGPRTTPSALVDVVPGVRLRTYAADGPPVLLVPAPIKRSYLWDLEPDVSVVRHAIRRGLQPFLVEWTDPQGDDPGAGLAYHADTLLLACLDHVTARTGAREVALAAAVPDIERRILDAGGEPGGGGPEDYAAMLREQITRIRTQVAAVGLRAE